MAKTITAITASALSFRLVATRLFCPVFTIPFADFVNVKAISTVCHKQNSEKKESEEVENGKKNNNNNDGFIVRMEHGVMRHFVLSVASTLSALHGSPLLLLRCFDMVYAPHRAFVEMLNQLIARTAYTRTHSICKRLLASRSVRFWLAIAHTHSLTHTQSKINDWMK